MEKASPTNISESALEPLLIIERRSRAGTFDDNMNATLAFHAADTAIEASKQAKKDGVLNPDTGQYEYPPEVTATADRALDDLRKTVEDLDHYLWDKVQEPDPPNQDPTRRLGGESL